MTLLAKVSEETHGDVVVAAIEGEIDASNTRGLGDRLRSALTNRATALVVDLTAVRYLDSAGINLLFDVGDAETHRADALAHAVADAAVCRANALDRGAQPSRQPPVGAANHRCSAPRLRITRRTEPRSARRTSRRSACA